MIMVLGMGDDLTVPNVCQLIFLIKITSIGLDHVALLGPDLASIARSTEAAHEN